MISKNFSSMSSVWCPISKFNQYFNILFSSTKKIRIYNFKTELLRLKNFKIINKKPLLIIPSLCGIIGKGKKAAEFNTTEELVHNVALATIALRVGFLRPQGHTVFELNEDGNIEKSGNMLLKTLDLAETNNFSVGIISACEMLSSLAIKLGDYERAECLLKKALDNLLRQGTPEDDNYVISFNLKLSRIHSSTGKDDLAETGFKKCLEMHQNKLKNSEDEEAFLLWSSILYWYGKFLLAKNRFQEAKSCFKDCFLTSLKVEELLPNQIMVILYNLGEVCEVLGEHDEAMEHLLKGVSLDKKCKNPDLTYFYSKLGSISMCKGLYKEAKVWCDQAQKFALKYQNHDAERESNECLQKLSAFFIT